MPSYAPGTHHPGARCDASCEVCCRRKPLTLRTAGRHPCPQCGRSDRTIRVDGYGLGPWRCVRCSHAFDPTTQAKPRPVASAEAS